LVRRRRHDLDREPPLADTAAEVSAGPLGDLPPADHRPQARVQPVRPDHQAEAPPITAREGHVVIVLSAKR